MFSTRHPDSLPHVLRKADPTLHGPVRHTQVRYIAVSAAIYSSCEEWTNLLSLDLSLYSSYLSVCAFMHLAATIDYY